MRLRLIRHATLVVEYKEQRLLVDPMLDDVGAREAIENSPNPRRNPLVPLPAPVDDVIGGVDAVLVTHTHSDHWDAGAEQVLARDLPLFCQRKDAAKFRKAGFRDVRAVTESADWNGIQLTRTGGQHGTGKIAKMLAPVSGYVLRAPGEPTVYIAGDTIYCHEVRATVRDYAPKLVVVNAGGARFLEGDPITMTADDVMRTCLAARQSQIVAVHMEAINHCLLTRADLAFQLEAARLAARVAIPQDGDWIDFKG
jgi:L-ascorbate metabolism protein UlaG (beta-lactamase superfamily)